MLTESLQYPVFSATCPDGFSAASGWVMTFFIARLNPPSFVSWGLFPMARNVSEGRSAIRGDFKIGRVRFKFGSS